MLASGKRRRVDDLLAELAEVRRTGVAFDEEEQSLGISAVGTAFADGLGQTYAVSIPAPTSRFEKNRERLVDAPPRDAARPRSPPSVVSR